VETEALLAKEPVATIAGRQYPLHKLGFEAMAPLARMLEIACERTGTTLTEIVSMAVDGEKVGRLFLSAMGWAHPEVFLLLGTLLGVTQDELRDPERFPIGGVGALIAPLVQQVDLVGFLSGRTAATSPEATPETTPTSGPSDESASSSSAEPAGQMMSSEASGSLAG